MIKKFNITVMLLGTIAFTACNTNGDKSSQQRPKPTTTQNQSAQQESKSAYGKVTFMDVDGNGLSLSQLKGKVVFINFWATWCPPCKEELPSIEKLMSHYKDNDDIKFLLVDVNEPMQKAVSFMKKNNYHFPVYIPKGSIPPDFLGNAIPTTVILNKSGEMAAHFIGARDYSGSNMKQKIDDLIKGKSDTQSVP